MRQQVRGRAGDVGGVVGGGVEENEKVAPHEWGQQ